MLIQDGLELSANNGVDTTLLIAIVSGIVAVLSSYITNVMSKRADNKKDLEIMLLQKEKEDLTKEVEACKMKDLSINKLKDTVIAIKKIASASNKLVYDMASHMQTANAVFKVIKSQYERDFVEDPKKLEPLLELEPIMEALSSFEAPPMEH